MKRIKYKWPIAVVVGTAVLSGVYMYNTAPPQRCCTVWKDATPHGLELCILNGRLGGFVAQGYCHDGKVAPGTTITFAPINKIVGRIGDWNKDGDCDAQDIAAFVDCLRLANGGDLQFNCRCVFDYDRDGDVDIEDFSELQRAFGSGNIQWMNDGQWLSV